MSTNSMNSNQKFAESSDNILISEKSPGGWGSRHTIAFLTFLGCIISYAMRINLSMAIVAMVHSSSNDNKNMTSNEGEVCSHLISENSKNTNDDGEFDWDSEEQGIILGAFFWGYVVTQVPGGILAEKFGAKWIIGGGLFLTAIFQLLTPIAARMGLISLIFVRVVQGLGEGVTQPAIHVLLAQWSPPLERSKLGSFVYSGNQVGTMTAMLLSGQIVNAGFLGGWPGVFYTFGIVGVIWFMAWIYFVSSTPSEHIGINLKELNYIQGAIGGQTGKHNVPTPWKKIFTSVPVYAILLAQIGNGWGLYTLLTELPTYMKNVLRYDMKENGLISALPYFCMFLIAIVASQIGDYLRVKNIFTTRVVRKIFNSIGHWGPAVALVGASYSGCDRILTVALLTIAVGLSGAVGPGYQVNHIDIAANHAGVLMGFCNGVANLAGIAAPYLAGVIIKEKGSLANWQMIFFISAGVYFLDNLFFIIFARGEEQPWNRPKEIIEIDEKILHQNSEKNTNL